jgi:hypothetical protein
LDAVETLQNSYPYGGNVVEAQKAIDDLQEKISAEKAKLASDKRTYVEGPKEVILTYLQKELVHTQNKITEWDLLMASPNHGDK